MFSMMVFKLLNIESLNDYTLCVGLHNLNIWMNKLCMLWCHLIGLHNWNIWIFERLNIWVFEYLKILILGNFDIITFEYLNIPTFEHLNIWMKTLCVFWSHLVGLHHQGRAITLDVHNVHFTQAASRPKQQ